jgi:hypothetical protein
VKVFHSVPQPSNGGSGVPSAKQHQTLEAEGRQLQSGQRIRSNAVSSSRRYSITTPGFFWTSVFFNSSMDSLGIHSNTAAYVEAYVERAVIPRNHRRELQGGRRKLD